MVSEAIIGALVGAFATALFTPVGEEFRVILSGKYSINKGLRGRWICTWTTEGDDEHITDHVEIVKVAGEKITGIGRNAYAGDYKISGRLSPFSFLSLTYTGTDRKSLLGGVILLEINGSRDKMHGCWWEYTSEKEFCGGSTTWIKEERYQAEAHSSQDSRRPASATRA